MRLHRHPLRTVGGLLCALALALTAGCGDSGPADSDTVAVWAIQDPQNEPIVTAGITSFNASSDVDLALTTYVNDAYKQKLQVSMGSPNAPEIFFNWGGGNLAQFVRARQVHALTEAMEDNPAVARAFLPSVLDVGKVEGQQYGLPMNGMQPVVMYYHKGVFADAGLWPPGTYQDLLLAVDTLGADGVVPIVLPGAQGWTELMYLEYLTDRIGGPEKFAAIADGEPGAWRDPAVLRALAMCQELAERGAFGDNFASINYDNAAASALFASGQAGMFLMGTWEYTNLAQRQPEFFDSGDLGWFAFPAVSGGAGDPRNVVGNPSNYFSVRAGAEHTDHGGRLPVHHAQLRPVRRPVDRVRSGAGDPGCGREVRGHAQCRVHHVRL